MGTRVCGKCHQEKPVIEFYTHQRDGYQSRCKACKREDDRLRNRTQRRREYNTMMHNRLVGQGYYEEYYADPVVRAQRASDMRRYAQSPILRPRFLARWVAKRAVRNGVLTKKPCSTCGSEKSQMHHPDYGKPLDVIWLCLQHHRDIHSKAEGKEV